MYEIVFKCSSCAAHLSASADDAGFEFECPICGAAIAVPAGDVLFACPQCRTSVLGSKNAIGEEFDCPHCQQRICVPETGVEVQIPERPTLKPSAAPPAMPPRLPEAAAAPKVPPSASDAHFMTTWGDYLAAAGLTDDEKPSNPNERAKSK